MTKGHSAVEVAVEHGIRSMTEQQIAAVPLQTQGPDSRVLGDVRAGSRIKRISAFLHELEEKRKIAEQLLAGAMREQFPEMEGKDVVLYQGWVVGLEGSGAETGDLFRLVGLKELVASRSTRSSDVNIGAIRGATVTN
jgi:hypothetical protein